MIKFIDDFFNDEDYKKIVNYCIKAPYYYGESDGVNRPNGMMSNIKKNNFMFDLINNQIKEKIQEIKNLKNKRTYINCFCPEEKTFFHTDGNCGITCLFYVNPDYTTNSNGQTEFILDEKKVIITPIPNRMAFFSSNIIHRATSFKDKHRFTIASKYS
jgi:hypothetical protein